MNNRTLWLSLLLCWSTGCVVSSGARQPVVGLRFFEGAGSTEQERQKSEFPLSVALISGAKLKFTTAAQLLKAAEEDPRKLMRAGRSLEAGNNVVLLGTFRSQEQGGGSIAGVAVYQVALACDPSDLESPGELANCAGYLLRVTRTWPGEVYELGKTIVSLIPEGGTAVGKLNGESAPTSQFRVKLGGDFVASLAQLGAAAGAETWAAPPASAPATP